MAFRFGAQVAPSLDCQIIVGETPTGDYCPTFIVAIRIVYVVCAIEADQCSVAKVERFVRLTWGRVFRKTQKFRTSFMHGP